MNHTNPFTMLSQDADSMLASSVSGPAEQLDLMGDGAIHLTSRTLVLDEACASQFLNQLDDELALGNEPTILVKNSRGLNPEFVDRLIREHHAVYVAGRSVRTLADQLSKAEVNTARNHGRIALLVILLGFVGMLTKTLPF